MTFGALAAIFAISFVFLGVGTGGGGFSISDLLGGGGGSSHPLDTTFVGTEGTGAVPVGEVRL